MRKSFSRSWRWASVLALLRALLWSTPVRAQSSTPVAGPQTQAPELVSAQVLAEEPQTAPQQTDDVGTAVSAPPGAVVEVSAAASTAGEVHAQPTATRTTSVGQVESQPEPVDRPGTVLTQRPEPLVTSGCYHGAAREQTAEGGRVLAKVLTGAVVGLDGALVEVEVGIAPGGMPNFLVVGLPDAAVQEARERVRAAIRNSGLSFPKSRMTVNLALAARNKPRGAAAPRNA